MSPEMINSFVAGAVALLVGLVAFFGSRWVNSTDKLGEAVSALNTTISALDKTQALHGERLTQHAGEIQELWTRSCQNPDCPYRGDRRRVI